MVLENEPRALRMRGECSTTGHISTYSVKYDDISENRQTKTTEKVKATEHGATGGRQEFNFTVPTGKTGLITGKGGKPIRSTGQQSGARTEL